MAVLGNCYYSVITKKTAHSNSASFIQHLRLQKGGAGVNAAEFASACVHAVVIIPTNSKPESQL